MNVSIAGTSWSKDSPIALVGGVFDPLHAGHVAYLHAAKQYGPLVCALSDAPEKHLPLVPLDHRKAILEALGVTSVIAHDGTQIPQIIRQLKPTYYVKGPDWVGKIPRAERDACAEVGTTVAYTTTGQASSTGLLDAYERTRVTQALEDFELFVQTQAAPEPWTPVTPYDRETRRAVEARHADILADIFGGLTVLDYGCGFGYLVELLQERGIDAVGWDPQFANTPGILTRRYHVVICREVLEHVPFREWPNVIWDLNEIAQRFIYITTRFTAKPHLLAVDGSDALDPTHISLANPSLLRTLCVLHGGRRRADLETRLDWMQKGRCLVYEVGA